MFRVVVEWCIHFSIQNMDFAIKYGWYAFFYWHFFLVSIFYLDLTLNCRGAWRLPLRFFIALFTVCKNRGVWLANFINIGFTHDEELNF